MVRVTVYGEPQSAGSKTTGVRKDGGRYVRDSNPDARAWKEQVAQYAGEAMRDRGARELLSGPLSLRLFFYRKRPKGHFGTGRNALLLRQSAPKYPVTKPDTTKLVRAVEDALSGVVYRDDAQIVNQQAFKRYGEPERVEIEVENLTD